MKTMHEQLNTVLLLMIYDERLMAHDCVWLEIVQIKQQLLLFEGLVLILRVQVQNLM